MYSLLILFFLLAIVISFLCSLWEAVLLSITPSYAQIQVREGGALGKRLQRFKENIDRPLAAILTLNTIANTAGAIGVGNQAVRIWASADPLITGVLVPVVMTLAVLVLSELIPKTIGANHWRELAPFTARSLSLVIRLLAPLVWFAQLVTHVLKKAEVRSAFTRSDFLAMADIGARHGVFEQHESDIINSLLKFGSVQAKHVMTPRTVVKVAPADQTLEGFFHANRDLRFSRIPIYEDDSRDQIVGYVLKDAVLAAMVEGHRQQPLSDLKRPIIIVGRDFPMLDLFKRFLATREHIALVVDEYGAMAGIVTMEDVIETLLGIEIVDEIDQTTDMQVLARRSWEQRAKRHGLSVETAGQREGPADQSDPPD